MKIIIAGAGDVGFHLAQLLTIENQDITLIDMDEDVLQYAATHLDVLTIKGDCSSVSVLESARVQDANLFLAVTTSEKTNLLTAILAKKMGTNRTIARVSNPEYLESTQKATFKELGVDVLISPQELAAQEIERLLKRSAMTDMFEFEDGKISVLGFTIDHQASFDGKTIRDLAHATPNYRFRAVAIQRKTETLIPSADTIILGGDHLYVSIDKKDIDLLVNFAGKSRKQIKKVMIVGSTFLALRCAQRLEDKYNVSIVASMKTDCKKLAETLHNTLIINGDPSNIDLLKEEGLESMDAFISLTSNAETNIVTSLMAKELGIYKTIAMVDNKAYTHLLRDIGVDTIINKKMIVANNIFRFVRKGKVEAITSLHGVEGEIIEFSIHHESNLTRKPIREIYFPDQAIIAGVVRGQSSVIPRGDFQLEIGDKVVVFARLDVISEVEEIFK